MKPGRRRFSLRPPISASPRAARRIFKTNCCRRCASSLADTWRRSRCGFPAWQFARVRLESLTYASNRQKESPMSGPHSDALVFFGATGDLAYKKIFPALQAMVRRGHLNVPVVGVAKSGWNLEQLKARARGSVQKHGGLDETAFEKLAALLRYVDGDYQDPTTFAALRKQLGSAQQPAYYLAIPPAMFGVVVERLCKGGCARGA